MCERGWSPMAACLVLGLATASYQAHAAQVMLLEPSVDGRGVVCDVRLTGQIVEGDRLVLERHIGLAKERSPFPRLCLDSQGGSNREAMLISEMVMQFGVTTALEAGATCRSACAFIFMAGTMHRSDFHGPDRAMHASATLGFHAPYLGMAYSEYLSSEIEERRGTGQEDRIADEIYRRAIDSARQLLALLARAEHDRYTFERRLWVKPSLIAELMKMAPDEFFYVDTVGKAGNYDIEVFGYRPISGDIADFVEDVCRNLHKWERDTFAGVDIPVRSPPSGWSEEEQRSRRRVLLGEDGDETRAAFVEVEDGGGGGPICGVRLDGKSAPWEGDCDRVQLAVRGYWGDEEQNLLANLKSFCVKKWQQYHFGTKLAEIAETSTESADRASADLDEAVAAAQAFFDAMSRPSSEALDILDDLYDAEVDYNGERRSHHEVLRDRESYFERWPDRLFVAEWGSTTGSCDAVYECDLTVHFKASSRPRSENQAGVARFNLRFSPEGKVVSEGEDVLSRYEPAEHFKEVWTFESELVGGR